MVFEKILFSSVILILLLIAGCTQPEKNEIKESGIAKIVKNIPAETSGTTPTSAPNPKSSTLRGFSLSPKSYEGKDFTGFFEKVAKTQNLERGTVISWAGDWNELGNEKGGPAVVMELAKQYNYVPLVEAQFFTQSTGKLLRPLDTETKQKYKESAVSFAKKYKPEYLAIGIEINILYEKSPEDFDNFVEFYPEVYTAIKEVSPNTKVFKIFQLEKMKGLNGGLFGGENNQANAQWQLLEKFKSQTLLRLLLTLA